jgi:N-succinyldiaminopimelate aminotransferase
LPLLSPLASPVTAYSPQDAIEFCASLPERCGVVAIPMAAFYDDRDAASTFVRFAFCKRGEVIAEAAQRLASLS